MNTSKKALYLLFNPQILSALIWAITIIACSWITDKSNISSILMTAAGFHVVLMSRFMQERKIKKS